MRVEAAPIQLTHGERRTRTAQPTLWREPGAHRERAACARATTNAGTRLSIIRRLSNWLTPCLHSHSEDSFQGQGLDVVWNHIGKRSAFVGSFAL